MDDKRFFWDNDPRRAQCPNPHCKKRYRVPIPKTEIIKCTCGTWFDPKEVFETSIGGSKFWISSIVQLPKGVKPIHFHYCICTWKGHKTDDGHCPSEVKIPVYLDRTWVACPKCDSSFALVRKVKMEWVIKEKTRNTKISKREKVARWDYKFSKEYHDKHRVHSNYNGNW